MYRTTLPVLCIAGSALNLALRPDTTPFLKACAVFSILTWACFLAIPNR